LPFFVCVCCALCPGNTFTDASGDSITIGEQVDRYFPVVLTSGEDSYFVTFQQKLGSWEIVEHGSSGSLMCGESYPPGTYTLSLSSETDCADQKMTFTLVSDPLCPARRSFFSEEFSLGTSTQPKCGEVNSVELNGRLSSSVASSTLSQQGVHITFAPFGYAVISISDKVILWQQWSPVGGNINVIDVLSIPSGYACDSDSVGQYAASWDQASGCGLQTCAVEDTCLARSELWHGANFNAFKGDMCADFYGNAPQKAEIFGSCSTGQQWHSHPYDCTDQNIEGGCVYCAGVAQAKDFEYCLARNGQDCKDIFEQVGTQQGCNLAFECNRDIYANPNSSSLISASIISLVALLIAYLI